MYFLSFSFICAQSYVASVTPEKILAHNERRLCDHFHGSPKGQISSDSVLCIYTHQTVAQKLGYKLVY